MLDGCIQLPCIGVVRLKEHDCLPTDKRITQATIRERAGRWFVSVLVEEEAPTGDIPSVATEDMSGELIEVATETVSNKATGDVLGGDVGIKTLATCSDGTCCANPKALAAKIKQLRRWQRRLSRRVKGGKNRSKARMKVARLHMQVANVRRDAHNKAAHAIPDKRPSVLVIEELNVKGMFKNCRLACALSDAAIGQFSLLSTALERGFGDQALFDGPGAERRENLCGGDRIDLSIDIV